VLHRLRARQVLDKPSELPRHRRQPTGGPDHEFNARAGEPLDRVLVQLVGGLRRSITLRFVDERASGEGKLGGRRFIRDRTTGRLLRAVE
jgi:hypothetical protein